LIYDFLALAAAGVVAAGVDVLTAVFGVGSGSGAGSQGPSATFLMALLDSQFSAFIRHALG